MEKLGVVIVAVLRSSATLGGELARFVLRRGTSLVHIPGSKKSDNLTELNLPLVWLLLLSSTPPPLPALVPYFHLQPPYRLPLTLPNSTPHIPSFPTVQIFSSLFC